MKNIGLILIVILLHSNELVAQNVIGKIVDENNDPISEVQLQLYAGQNIYYSASTWNGSFGFNLPTSIENEQLPDGFYISNNYPNPFNPKTRIIITLPKSSSLKIEIYNTLGQSVKEKKEQFFDAGINTIELILDGLPNGIYIARITIDEKYIVSKKLMLLYGSQHLNPGKVFSSTLNKMQNKLMNTLLDSIVAQNSMIGRKKITGLPQYIGGILDLGNLTIERFCPGMPTVNYEGKTYNTVLIGNQCWLKENLDVGTHINSGQNQSNNGIIEKYCYNNQASNCEVFGGLYTWDEAMQYSDIPGSEGICPPGWHIPTYTELQTLKSTVNNNANALKAFGIGYGNGAGTNTSGFTSLFAGHCQYNTTIGYYFMFVSNFAYFWRSSNIGGGMTLRDATSEIIFESYDRRYGLSIRCLKN